MKKLLSYIKNSAFLPICAGIAAIQPQLSAQIQELYFNDEFDRMIFTMKIRLTKNRFIISDLLTGRYLKNFGAVYFIIVVYTAHESI